MDFQTWAPVYEAILADFGFPRENDEIARDELAHLVDPRAFDRKRLDRIAGARVVIAGGGPSLDEAIDRLDRGSEGFVIGVSTAVDELAKAGITVDLMVTDLDKNPETVRRATEQGTPVAVHAHGDNRPALRAVVPDLPAEQVLATTQAAPADGVANVGGFTDGDRAAFLADAFGAGELEFIGWDFDDPTVAEEKRRKLRWAERLLYWLESRRGERFSVLTGRRNGIDTSALPID